jgi:phospholipase C
MKVRVSRPLYRVLSLLAVTLSSLLLVTGCGSVHPGSDTPTVTISASPTSITAGQSSTLTVAATNATTVTITGDGSTHTLAATGGTLTVKPTKTTTYTATASGSGGNVTATATVTVGASTGPTVTITANPTSIAAGATSTLTVAATNATTVKITGDDGSSYDLAATGGTQAVTPTKTTTYTATAAGATGTTPATATATVTVTGAKPTVTVTANPATITAGSASSLTIAVTNATSVTVAGSDGTSYTLPSPAGGTQAVSPAATTTYTVTATGAGGTATATATVTVVPAPPPPVPTVSITASPTTIQAGSSSVLTITATNATSLVVAGSDGSSFSSPALPPTGGTETVKPAATTSYTITATGPGGSATAEVTVTVVPVLTVTITASPSSIALGSTSTLTVAATNATGVTVKGTDGSSYTLAATGGTQPVTPTSTTTYTATAVGVGGTTPVSANATVTVVPPGTVKSINHVLFMLQENHTFDNYFGMLNPYRKGTHPGGSWDIGADGKTYDVDGIDDKINGESYDAVRKSGQVISNKDKQGGVHTLYKLKSTCIDDASSAWSESFGDVSLGNALTTRPIFMNGYVSNGDGFANSKCPGGVGPCTGYTDTTGDRTMGYYDEGFLNYYYYMASQFALSDRWFSPIESKSIPNRIATFTGGTTQGLTQDPSGDDKLNALTINNIFQELDTAGVSWKVYYTVTNAQCDPQDCKKGSTLLPSTTFSYLTYSYKYVGGVPPSCTPPKQPDSSNSFCVDPHHIAYLKDPTYGYFADLKNGTLPSFVFIESGSGLNDEHPGYQQTVLAGQFEVASIINALMTSTSWGDSVFFLAYDEGGGPYDHVPPVPGHTNDFTDASAAGDYPQDVSKISVQPDSYYPCVPLAVGDLHCDLRAGQPGSNPGDAAAPSPGAGFGAQVGFRVPNMVVSPFVKEHYVSHIPMDHTAVIKFVEDRFIGSSAHLTARDAAQPDLLDFFDFGGVPWATPPTPPAAITNASFPSTTCTPQTLK